MVMKFILGFISLCLFAVLACVGAVLVIFWVWGEDLPDYRQLAQYEPPVATRIHAGNGALLAEFATQKRLFVPAKAMPPQLVEAFLSAEDKSFYNHRGIDPVALLRAMASNIAALGSGRRPVGASTITQQVAKNFLLSNEISIDRKIKEAILAIRIERAFSKEQILALYLNEIYLGYGSYGVAAAALNYFDKALNQLELHEIAYLAALPKAPSNYHPLTRTKSALGRRNWVLQQMYKNGYISALARDAAQSAPLATRPPSGFDSTSAPYFTEEVRRELVSEYGTDVLYEGGLSVRTTLDPGLQEKAQQALRAGLEALDRRQGWRGPLARWTRQGSIDARLSALTAQLPEHRYAALVTDVRDDRADIYVEGKAASIPFAYARWAYPPRLKDGERPQPIKSLRQALSVDDIVVVHRHADGLSLKDTDYQPQAEDYVLGQIPEVNGAIIVLDPHSGRLLAMVGGYDYRLSEFNRATQAQRQPGSAFKPFVYLAALESGYSPTTQILDAPLVVDQGEGLPKWKPANYTRRFYGPSIMRVGIEKSRNLMTARLALALGMPKIQEYARRFGIDEDLPPLLSMSLGAGETSLARLTAAYGQLVNGGKKISVSMIDRIQNRFGHTIRRHDERVCPDCAVPFGWAHQPIPLLLDSRESLIDPASAYQMVSMLEGAVTRGTGRQVGKAGLVLAGKTGTTNDNTNAWFIGFSPDLVAGVYVGYDTPRPLGKHETGSSAAAPIFKQFMIEALRDAPVIPFRRPGGISIVPIHAETGARIHPDDKMAVLEVFKPGQIPGAGARAGRLIDVPASISGTLPPPASATTTPALY